MYVLSADNPTVSWCTLSKVCANKSLRLTRGGWKSILFCRLTRGGWKSILFCRLTRGGWKKQASCHARPFGNTQDKLRVRTPRSSAIFISRLRLFQRDSTLPYQVHLSLYHHAQAFLSTQDDASGPP